MASFTLGDRTYHLRLTHGLVKRVAAETGLDLYAVADDQEWYVRDVLCHTYRLYPAVYAAVKDQTPLGYDAWLDPLDGPAAEAVRAAVLEAFADFFPGLPTSQTLRAAGGAAAYLERLAALAAGRSGGPSGSAGGPGPPASAPTP